VVSAVSVLRTPARRALQLGLLFEAPSFSIIGFLVSADLLYVVIVPQADILPAADAPLRLTDLACIQPSEKRPFMHTNHLSHFRSGKRFHLHQYHRRNSDVCQENL